MRPDFAKLPARVRPAHAQAWLWEPLEADPGFVLRPMFGGQAAYVDGKLALFFVAKRESPWCGVLVCTGREHHAALQTRFPELAPHPVLSKWLYLPETSERFEGTAQQLVALARQRDPRLGVVSPPKQSRPRGRGRPPPKPAAKPRRRHQGG